MVAGKLVQYQILTEPVYVETAPAEDITLDKWFQPLCLPVKPVRARSSNLTFVTFTGLNAGDATPTITLEDLFCGTFATQSDFLAFISLFNTIIANQSLISVETFNYLDSYLEDKRVDDADRDYWLDKLLRRYDIPVAGRLPWSGDDPLGLQTNTDSLILIDSSSSNAKYVKRSSNSVYTDSGYTVAASPALLWDNNTSGSTYNHKIWADIVSLDEAGSATRRRFPPNGKETTVLVRGGTYTLAQEITIALQTTNVPLPIPNRRIIWRNYPGESPVINSGNSFNGTDYLVSSMYSISRPDFIFGDGIEFIGFRDDGATRIFGWAQFIIYGARSKLIGANIHNTHGLDPFDTNAGSFPDYVDDAYNDRSAALIKHAIQWQADYGLVRDITLKLADSDFPSSGFASDGEGIDNNSDNTVFRRNTFTGIVFHTQLRSRDGTGTLIEYNDFSNYADTTCLNVYNSSFVTVRYNRVHGYCQTTGPTNDGNGMQIQDTNDSEFYENVVFNDGLENPGWGIRLGCEPGVGTGHRNIVRNNILYRSAIALRYYGGWNAGAYMDDNEVYDNVIVDLPDNNKLTAAYDAPVLVLIGSSTGNLIYDNLIMRLDASATMLSVQTGVGTHVTYDIDDTYIGYTGNYTSDPLFRDPAGGDFRLLEGSPVTALFTSETPLTPFYTDGEVYNCPISLDKFVQPISQPVLPEKRPWIESSINPALALPNFYQPVAELLVNFQPVPTLPKNPITSSEEFGPVLTLELSEWITHSSWTGSNVVPKRLKRQFTGTEFVEPFTTDSPVETITVDKWFQLFPQPIVKKDYIQNSGVLEPLAIPNYYQPVAELLVDYAVIPVQPRQRIDFLEPAYWYGILTDIPENPVEPAEPEVVVTQYPTIYSAIFNTFDIDI